MPDMIGAAKPVTPSITATVHVYLYDQLVAEVVVEVLLLLPAVSHFFFYTCKDEYINSNTPPRKLQVYPPVIITVSFGWCGDK